MRSWRGALLLCLTLAAPGGAWAQPAEPEKPAAEAQKLADVGARYNEAVEAMKARRWAMARRLLKAFLESPEPRPAELSAGARALLEVADWLAETEARGESTEGPDRSGRVELVAYTTLYGIWTGIAGSIVAELNSLSILATVLTGGGALTASLLATREGEFTEGQAALVSTAGNWATWNGVALSMALYDGDNEGDVVLSAATLAGLAGITGALIFKDHRPDEGDVALAGTGGYVGTFSAGMIMLIATDADVDEDVVLPVLVTGSDLGLAAGAWLSTRVDMSRGRTRLLDLGTALGALTTGGLLAASQADVNARVVGATLLGGGLGGLWLTTHLTRDWDEDESQTAWRGEPLFGAPAPYVVPARRGDEQGYVAGLHLLTGVW